jgi:hypothetical protein
VCEREGANISTLRAAAAAAVAQHKSCQRSGNKSFSNFIDILWPRALVSRDEGKYVRSAIKIYSSTQHAVLKWEENVQFCIHTLHS